MYCSDKEEKMPYKIFVVFLFAMILGGGGCAWDEIALAHLFKQQNLEYTLDPLVAVVTSDGDFIGTGFVVNSSHVVTVKHVIDAFQRDEPVLFVLNPIYTLKASCVLYSSGRPQGLLQDSFFSAFPIAKLKPLQKECAVPAKSYFLGNSDAIRAGGKLIRVSIPRFHEGKLEFDFPTFVMSGEKDRVARSLEGPQHLLLSIPGAEPGESGSPVFYFDKFSRTFKLGGITDRMRFAIKVEALESFLKSNNIPFNK